ncbi:MAG: hypothetical protein HY908_13310 [Myxococcales bacterium]|nr:hypothetical protein [Myxococcales bacterium]
MTGHATLRATLRRELRRLTRDFADALLEVLERHGVFEEPDEDEPALRVRRSQDALDDICERVLVELRGRRQPEPIGTIAHDLGTEPRYLAHPLALLVERGVVVRTGRRRGARYALARPAKRTARPPAGRS